MHDGLNSAKNSRQRDRIEIVYYYEVRRFPSARNSSDRKIGFLKCAYGVSANEARPTRNCYRVQWYFPLGLCGQIAVRNAVHRNIPNYTLGLARIAHSRPGYSRTWPEHLLYKRSSDRCAPHRAFRDLADFTNLILPRRKFTIWLQSQVAVSLENAGGHGES